LRAKFMSGPGPGRPRCKPKSSRIGKELISEVEEALNQGEVPESAHARLLAERWSALLSRFTGGDPEVQKGLNKFYADQGNWPQAFQKPFSDEVSQFIKKVMAAHNLSCA
ncbi:MAG: TipAS antibiotic-recognition domain-containing protein, partial [Candidatus Angelobacter sp.]